MNPPNRIDLRFAELARAKKKAFVAYITAGDPHLRATARLCEAFERVGVDVIELGVPFSDPLADGVVNQLAADRALRAGTTLCGILQLVHRLRRKGLKVPIVLFTYFNPIHRYGLEKFARDAARAGVDGILNLDLSSEESDDCARLMERKGLHPIYLIAPTTHPRRIRGIAQKARGFIYYVSQEGVTGMRRELAGGLSSKIQAIRRHTKLPIVVGFGISTPQQVKRTSRIADGCVVGSAIVNQIARIGNRPSLVPEVQRLVSRLVRPLR